MKHIIHPTSDFSPRITLNQKLPYPRPIWGLISQQLAIEFGDKFEMI